MASVSAIGYNTTSLPNPTIEIDPHSYLRPGLRALGGQGKRIGTIDRLEYDTATDRLSALIIRHGLLRNRLTSVPTDQVKWVNQDSVVLNVSLRAFKRLSTL